MAVQGIELSAGIAVGVNKPVDAKYGPYNNIGDALDALTPTSLRYKGLTVGILIGGEIIEYWFKSGIAGTSASPETSDLIVKSTGSGSAIEQYANLATFPVPGEANTIYIALNTELSYYWDGSTYQTADSNVETYANFAALPSTGQSTNTIYITTDNNNSYYWNGSAYILTSEGTFSIADNSLTLSKLEQVANLRVLGNTSGSTTNVSQVTVIDDDAMTTALATNIPTAESVKAYVDNRRVLALSYSASQALTLSSSTNYITITLTGNATLTTVTGAIIGREYYLLVNNNAPTVPWQITFGAGFSLDDGIEPFLKSIVVDKLDVIKMVGVSSTKLQIVDVIYGS